MSEASVPKGHYLAAGARVAELEASVDALVKAGNSMALWLNADSPPVRQWYAVANPLRHPPLAAPRTEEDSDGA